MATVSELVSTLLYPQASFQCCGSPWWTWPFGVHCCTWQVLQRSRRHLKRKDRKHFSWQIIRNRWNVKIDKQQKLKQTWNPVFLQKRFVILLMFYCRQHNHDYMHLPRKTDIHKIKIMNTWSAAKQTDSPCSICLTASRSKFSFSI